MPEKYLLTAYFVIIGIALGVGLMIFIQGIMRKKDFVAMADKMGFTFKPEKNHLIGEYQLHFKIFDKGRSKKITSYMEKEKNGVTISVFDYKYTTGGGKNSSTHKNCFVTFKNPSFSFPKFTLMPENRGHRFIGAISKSMEKSIIGFNDIDFVDSPTFSDAYLLGGPDEEQIKSLFTKEVRDSFEGLVSRKKNITTIMAKGDTIMFFTPQGGVKIKAIPEYIQTCNKYIAALV